VSLSEPIWITGVGTANPIGHDFASTAEGLLAGRSGVRTIDRYPLANHPCRIAGLMDPVPVPPGWDKAEFRALEPLPQLVFWCVTSALVDAGLWPVPADRRVGLVLGIGAEWMFRWESASERGPGVIPKQQSIASAVQQRLGLTGPVTTVGAACASGNVALAQAQRWLRHGWADLVIAGGCDTMVTPLTLASFDNLRVLSRRACDPTAASRPFDRGRDGFVMGEGGALLVLEPEPAARGRSARPYAELAGTGGTSDAFHLIIPGQDPGPAIAAIRRALADAQADASEIDYVNAHATSTPAGDSGEARIICEVLGSAGDRVAVSSTKSMTGHLLSAAAAIEAVACLVALQRQAIPPTINLDEIDPECPLDHVANVSQERPVRLVMSNSFGFGGTNCCALFRRVA
jgi:3-oxoacyl-[acyl-carrier-protein] synthase II